MAKAKPEASDEMAKFFGVDRRTWYRWKADK